MSVLGEGVNSPASNVPNQGGVPPVNLSGLLTGPSRSWGGSQQRRNVEAAILWSVSASTLTTTTVFPTQPPFVAADWSEQFDIWVVATVALTNGGTGPTGLSLVMEAFSLRANTASSGTADTATLIPAGGNTNLCSVGPLVTAAPTFAIQTTPTATIPYGSVQVTCSSFAAFGPGVLFRVPYGNVGCFGLVRPGLATLGAGVWSGGTIQVIAHFRA